jgi:hypothetical protein
MEWNQYEHDRKMLRRWQEQKAICERPIASPDLITLREQQRLFIEQHIEFFTDKVNEFERAHVWTLKKLGRNGSGS